ncbi:MULTISPECIES: DUF4230 domain-containing protein [Clostridium]|uniref:DUF4230 domain-containing protein n=1 Tax=Clostridium TaxID=1485 RepID=UPI000825F471|nr:MULTISPECIES: DUF4230 domain-containing protein [Clostridium]PJI08238.1 DUF4230 domain-containing protein [Clostridium sp. CT7]
MKITIRKKTLLIIMLICIVIGFFAAYKFFNRNSNSSSKPWTVANANDISKKFISKETLIKKIEQKQKLITTEVEISEKVTIDNSWGNLDVFKKIQNISFTGTGIYAVDLSNLKNSNLSINNETKIITLKISKPQIEAINIDDDKTEYQTDNGLLRFGEIKLTPEEHEAIMENVKKDMNKKMMENDYYSKATSNSKKSIRDMIKSILGKEFNYSLTIDFTK